jgi:hypothetical protein
MGIKHREYIESITGTIGRECLDHVIVSNEESRHWHLFVHSLLSSNAHAPGRAEGHARASPGPAAGCRAIISIPEVGGLTRATNPADRLRENYSRGLAPLFCRSALSVAPRYRRREPSRITSRPSSRYNVGLARGASVLAAYTFGKAVGGSTSGVRYFTAAHR